ncbi:unnamed protein product [Parnassius mnemosyne]|uniref:Reverse transcriptase domain-containing protein n=1 Tax=Parnassius mnemosyne TaxID=213953 RepID=A0AAV1KI85_9NEOP
MSIYGKVPVFDCKTDEWVVHVAQLNNFFIANGIDDITDAQRVRRRAILLNSMSQDSYRLTRDLLYPNTPESTDYKAIIAALDGHFDPKKCIYAERQKFYSAKKDPHESMVEYAARLRGLASACCFGTALEMCLTDRFVLGLDTASAREKLFREDPNQLKLNKALEVACAVESAQRIVSAGDSAELIKSEPVLYTDSRRKATASGGTRGGRARGGGDGGAPRCSVCGARSHDTSVCGYRHLSCNLCGAKGHLKRMCSKRYYVHNEITTKKDKIVKKQHNGMQNNYILEGSDRDECNDFSPINNVRDINNESRINTILCKEEKPISLEVIVRGVTLSMEVDSGSGVSALPARIWYMYFSRNLSLGESNKTLYTYSGSALRLLGMCYLPVTYNNVTHNIKFYVVENGPVPLLGRDFMTKFNFAFISLNYCSVDKEKFILSKYKTLFSGGLGTFNKYKLTLHLKEGVTPKFFKARPVPFALKNKVSAELDRLVRAGILKPVSYSNYASPIVAVLKKNNDVRIFGDYSMTINKALIIDSYPLPKISELCASLHDCRYFSRLDLSNSYNQFLLDDESQKYTCINTHKGLFVYTRLVFGLSNAPALFQRAMVQLLQGIDGVECFLDDLLIAAPTAELHWERVDLVLSRLRDAGLMLQRSKCSFFQNKIEYLGFVIDRFGLHKNPDKIKAITQARVPGNV